MSATALTEQLGAWMEGYTALKADHESLKSRHDHVVRQLQAVTSERAHWKTEAERGSMLLRAKQASLEQCTSLLSLMRSVEESMPPPENRSSAEQEARQALEQRLELRSAELQALRTRLLDAEAKEQLLLASRDEADRLRIELSKFQLELAPVRADAEERKRVNKKMREQLGKSETERHRQRAEFQTELTSMGKRLRVAKQQAEALQRANGGRCVGAPAANQSGGGTFGAAAMGAAYPW